MAKRLECGTYFLDEVISALQKSIRRGEAKQAMYWARELMDNGFTAYMWRRLAVTAVEDCGYGDSIAHVAACHYLSHLAMKNVKTDAETNAVASAILRMCEAIKSRAACDLDAAVEFDRKNGLKLAMPPWALDMHTGSGKEAGKVGSDGITDFCMDGRTLDREAPNKYRKQLFTALKIFDEEMVESLDALHKMNEVSE